eukprot:maker-scaffold308_size214241-snap-gene-0.27 protein:Tk09052 transcript:maker-scaffold308_size214241-snap-gene-0.27-mRNA-1 annotation:"hypothetical protein DAPPUDRAFT_304281"
MSTRVASQKEESTSLPKFTKGLPFACIAKLDESERSIQFHISAQVQRSTTKNSYLTTKHVVAMVGLPARGKSYISEKLKRYLNWIHINTRKFNVGVRRRQEAGESQKTEDFFSKDNVEAMRVREKLAAETLEEALNFLETEGGQVAVFDATNVSLHRRAFIYRRVVEEKGFKLLFIESICDKEELITKTVREVKAHGKDFEDCPDKEEVMRRFQKRIELYKLQYTPLGHSSETEYSYIKIINGGEQIVMNRHEGYLQAKIGFWVMNIRITPTRIYFTRHGESQDNLLGKIGGDSLLSEAGERFATSLAEHFNQQDNPDLHVWTSWMKRTIQTASQIQAPKERWKALNEIDGGICDGLTYAEIERQYPVHYKAREIYKLTYRYPEGESYEDLCLRLESVIMELERRENVLVVSHQAVLRCLLAYFVPEYDNNLPYITVPLHHVIILEPNGLTYDVVHKDFGISAVNTHRQKGSEPRPDPAITEEQIRAISSQQLYADEGRIAGAYSSPKYHHVDQNMWDLVA